MQGKQDTIGLHLEGVVLIRHPTDAAWGGLETYTGILLFERVRDFSCDYLRCMHANNHMEGLFLFLNKKHSTGCKASVMFVMQSVGVELCCK